MGQESCSRRDLLSQSGAGALAALSASGASISAAQGASTTAGQDQKQGSQRLSLTQLRKWETLGYGMFIHFGMSTFVGQEIPDGKSPAPTYAPDRLDVDQWISVARDAGMTYAVLTAKHVAGHCLWPSKHTNHTVANSTNHTDVVERFVTACRKHGVSAGLYYCSWDNHNRFGSRTPSDRRSATTTPENPPANLPPFTTSLYQTFQTAQLTELLTQYGPIAEVWVDIPSVLGRGYRTFLYEHIARLQPETVIMMNNGIGTGEALSVEGTWPTDLISIERRLPPELGHVKWRTIEGKDYYIPGEVCDPIGKNWFFVPGDEPRPDEELLTQYRACRERGVNLLLNVPPDKHGLVPQMHVKALARLRTNAGR